MKNLNFLLIALIATVTTHNTFTQKESYTSDDRSDCSNVYLASPEYTFEAEFRALILKPTASNLHYAAQAKPLPVISPNWSIFDIKPKYHFGFDLGVRAHCHNRSNTVALNWTHFNSSTNTIHPVPVLTDMIGPFFEIGPDAESYKNAAGRVKFNFNAAHLTFGQHVQFGDCLETNFFAGINVTSLKESLSFVYTNTSATVTRTISAPNSFIGAGPEFGFEFAYDIVNNLNFTGKCSAAILMGPAKNNTVYTSESPLLIDFGLTAPNVQNTSVDKRTLIVPTFEERLGLAYDYRYCDSYAVRLEVGYEARVYFNALQSVDMGSEVVNIIPGASNVGVYARTFQRNSSNFALGGPYVALSAAF